MGVNRTVKELGGKGLEEALQAGTSTESEEWGKEVTQEWASTGL